MQVTRSFWPGVVMECATLNSGVRLIQVGHKMPRDFVALMYLSNVVGPRHYSHAWRRAREHAVPHPSKKASRNLESVHRLHWRATHLGWVEDGGQHVVKTAVNHFVRSRHPMRLLKTLYASASANDISSSCAKAGYMDPTILATQRSK